jgi:hypothetical protein
VAWGAEWLWPTGRRGPVGGRASRTKGCPTGGQVCTRWPAGLASSRGPWDPGAGRSGTFTIVTVGMVWYDCVKAWIGWDEERKVLRALLLYFKCLIFFCAQSIYITLFVSLKFGLC